MGALFLFREDKLADGRGGYQRPRKPAAVSGPGRLSQRTDGGPGQPVRALNDAAYGEQATFRSDQQSAPMASTPGPNDPGQAAPPADTSQVIPFGAPSQRPGEPITAGAATGAGPGTEALGMGGADPGMQYMRALLPMFEIASTLPSANQEFRQFVRRLRASA